MGYAYVIPVSIEICIKNNILTASVILGGGNVMLICFIQDFAMLLQHSGTHIATETYQFMATLKYPNVEPLRELNDDDYVSV